MEGECINTTKCKRISNFEKSQLKICSARDDNCTKAEMSCADS